jgi:hypothetical protein
VTPQNLSYCLDRYDLLGDANNTASRTWASIASLKRLLVAALAKVISAGMDDDSALMYGSAGIQIYGQGGDGTYSDDALGSDQLDKLVLDGSLGVALAIRLEVA